jgi:hypothetical protein
MTDDAQALLARLRAHMLKCARCDPADGVYCPTALPDAERFWDVRRDQVEADGVALRLGMRRG